jgi:hypothetical protein
LDEGWPPKALAILFSPTLSSNVRAMTGKRFHFSSLRRPSRWQPTMTLIVRCSGSAATLTVTTSPGAA